MDVRLARPTDALLALTLALDDRAHLIRGADQPEQHGVFHTVLRACLPVPMRGRTWIARDQASSGLLEATPRRYVIGWDITRLAIHGEHSQVLPPLIDAAVEHLRSRRVPRLFARCSEEAAEELKPLAFHPLAREYVLIGPDRPVEDATLPDDSRYRMPQDAWPLHQLESAVTPGAVRQLEGLTSQEWSHRVSGMSEVVVEREGRVVGWVGWGRKAGPDLHQIGLLVHPAHRDLAPDLLLHALKSNPGRRFVARVRGYQQEVLTAFCDAGFAVVTEEIILLRHARVEIAPQPKRVLVLPQVPAPTVRLAHRPPATRTPSAS